jgi:hypothetical protein
MKKKPRIILLTIPGNDPRVIKKDMLIFDSHFIEGAVNKVESDQEECDPNVMGNIAEMD